MQRTHRGGEQDAAKRPRIEESAPEFRCLYREGREVTALVPMLTDLKYRFESL